MSRNRQVRRITVAANQIRQAFEILLASDSGGCPGWVIRDQGRATNKRGHVRYAPKATDLRSAGKCRDGPIVDIHIAPNCAQVTGSDIEVLPFLAERLLLADSGC